MRRFLVIVAGILVSGLFVLPASAEDTTVQLVDNAFKPKNVTIRVGDTVTWEWMGENDHSVRSDDAVFFSHPLCSTAQSCGSTGESFQYTFLSAGTFTVYCEVHADMTSTVTVEEPAPSPSPSAEPSAEPSPQPSPEPDPTPDPPSPEPDPPPSEPSPEPEPATEEPPTDEGAGRAVDVPTPDVAASETTALDFEPFVEPPDLPTSSPTTDDVVVAAPTAPSSLARGVGLGIGLTALATWLVGFGRFVLFADPWDA